jgi:protein arginine kinase activator
VLVRQSHGTEHRDFWLCDECCKELHVSGDLPAFGPTVRELLGSMVGGSATRTCPQCGSRFSDVRTTGRVGCAECYRVFSDSICDLLSEEGVPSGHVGRYPERLAAFKRILVDRSNLKLELEAAVAAEDYETAAQIRDRINELGPVENGHA